MRKSKKTVGDEGTTPRLTRGNRRSPWPVNEARCCFCGLPGNVVSKFPRRGYG